MKWLITQPPKGGLEDCEGEIKHGKTKGDKYIYQTWVSPRIIGCANLWTTETYWMPPEGKSKGRWHKFNESVELDGWMPMPEPKE